jgi:hypothetical protein
MPFPSFQIVNPGSHCQSITAFLLQRTNVIWAAKIDLDRDRQRSVHPATRGEAMTRGRHGFYGSEVDVNDVIRHYCRRPSPVISLTSVCNSAYRTPAEPNPQKVNPNSDDASFCATSRNTRRGILPGKHKGRGGAKGRMESFGWIPRSGENSKSSHTFSVCLSFGMIY